MDSFSKITNLSQELNLELNALKKELENDVNYSTSHADIVTSIESAEEILHEFNIQMRNIESDVEYLDESINEQRFGFDDDDYDDDIERQMWSDSPFADD